jgi:hypothetical protein
VASARQAADARLEHAHAHRYNAHETVGDEAAAEGLCDTCSVTDSPFTLAGDGDVVEQAYWRLFLASRFPSYERFWAAEVVSVTRRGIDRRDIRFRSDDELGAVGRTHEDVAIAQIHYTVMSHLGRAHGLLRRPLDRWGFAEVFVRLSGASDCADELLERATNRGVYDPWSEDAGRRARNRWRDVHGRPLQPIHDYRNRLVHGRVVPEIIANVISQNEQVFIYPRIDRVEAYLDWRRALDDVEAAVNRGDFQDAQSIALEAWEEVVDYCEQAWRTHLVSPAPSELEYLFTPATAATAASATEVIYPDEHEPPPPTAGSASGYRP